MQAFVFEFIGTFFLTLTIAISGDPLAIGIILASLVYAGGTVSGAHYNPAVSFALYIRKKISATQLKGYIFSQSAGAILAAVVSANVFQKVLIVQPAQGVSWIHAVAAECMYTFLFVTVVLHVAASKKTQGNNYFGIAIGGTIFAAAKSVGSFSGGAFNPAVGIAPFFVNSLLGTQGFDPSLIFLYTIGPMSGAILASLVHQYTQR